MSTAKGYGLAEITLHDDAYREYMGCSEAAVAAAGGRFLVHGGAPEVIEGDRKVTRVALVEFDNVAQADAFYEGQQYREAARYRAACASCHHSVLVGNDAANTAPRRDGSGKAYIYAEMHPTDIEKYMEYPRLSTPIVSNYGGAFIVRGGSPRIVEGGREPGRVVIVEFDSVEAARTFYFSPEYQEALKWRQRYATSHLYLLQGVRGHEQ